MTDIIWEARDAHQLSEFLNSPTGVRLKLIVDGHGPTLGGDNFEEKALRAAAFEQWMKDKALVKRHADVGQFIEKKEPESPYQDLSGLEVR